MAKLLMSVDTESGEFSVQVNGQDIPDVYSVEFYNYGEGRKASPHFSITTSSSDGDLNSRVCITASEHADPKRAVNPSRIPGMVEMPVTSDAVKQAMAALFDRSRPRR